MNYKAVLFDLDGVLIDSEPLHIAAFQASLKQYGYDLNKEGYDRYFAGKTDEFGFGQYFSNVGTPPDAAEIMAEKADIYLQLSKDRLVSYPEAVELVRELSLRATLLALVTGSLRNEAELTLETLGISSLFSAIVTAEDLAQSKPSPEGYLKAATLLDVEPADCIVIEDSPSGVRAAQAAGMRCLAVSTTHTAQALDGATKIVDRLHIQNLDLL
jgi:beta-phosphoglucomutase